MTRFYRHMNHAMGKEYHTAKDYYSDMKKMNLVPSDSPEAQPKKYEKKPYKPSAWARDMTRDIHRRTDKNGNVHLSTVMIDQLQSRLKATPKEIKDKLKGGFYKGE